jgi:sortase A
MNLDMNPITQPSNPAIPVASTRQASSTRRNLLRGACYFLLAFGILDLSYAGFVYARSYAFQAQEMQKFEQAVALPNPEPRVFMDGDVIGEMQVPRLGLSVMVVQGDSPANLRRAVAHISSSPLPGELGNVAFAGHRDTFFSPLRNILIGDEITFKTPARTFTYLVESIHVVAPSDLQVLDPTAGHDLTLVTCYPFYYVGPAPKRFIVRAREIVFSKEVESPNEVGNSKIASVSRDQHVAH